METLDVRKIHLQKFWDDEYKHLNYIREPFNDPDSLEKWIAKGFSGPFTGYMCDMRSPQPSWNNRFIEIFQAQGWKDIGTSYYRMEPGTVLPNHQDLYKKYIELFDLKGQEHWIYRAIVFLEDWQSGHYSEVNGTPFVGWRSGDCLVWRYSTAHIAANIGDLPRYTLQITGHK